jgi:uncharacterized protein YodC (DUF2158 family)
MQFRVWWVRRTPQLLLGADIKRGATSCFDSWYSGTAHRRISFDEMQLISGTRRRSV